MKYCWRDRKHNNDRQFHRGYYIWQIRPDEGPVLVSEYVTIDRKTLRPFEAHKHNVSSGNTSLAYNPKRKLL